MAVSSNEHEKLKNAFEFINDHYKIIIGQPLLHLESGFAASCKLQHWENGHRG